MQSFGVREMDRWSVLERVRSGDMMQVQAAERLGLSVRQVRRLSWIPALSWKGRRRSVRSI